MRTDKGKIIRGVGGFYYVVTRDATIYECRAKGIFRKDDVKPLVGDDVMIGILDEENRLGNVDEILPRKNALIRPPVANVDQAMVVVSAKSPGLNRGLLDRFLLMMEVRNIPVWICLTKTDLVNDTFVRGFVSVYEKCSEGVLAVSNVDGSGIRDVRMCMKGKTTVLAGPSGVGKSSLVGHICPDAAPETGVISKKTQRGKHTTRHSELFMIAEDTFLFDTPGFSSLALPELLPEELSAYMPEFDEYRDGCRYRMCTHIHEPDCAVISAVGDTIDEKRYESYKMFFAELNERAVKEGRSSR
ncbi:MAG TPA: ribosome small subunit-dependent GTPase A [Lachnospiraceae bacterium]|nr:ribosome small subunit-dependent GTPase A [Lachnospiraceae bacterium]